MPEFIYKQPNRRRGSDEEIRPDIGPGLGDGSKTRSSLGQSASQAEKTVGNIDNVLSELENQASSSGQATGISQAAAREAKNLRTGASQPRRSFVRQPIGKSTSGGVGEGKAKDVLLNGAGGAAKSFLQKHRKKLIVFGAGGASLGGIIGLLLFLVGLMAVPNYAENIAARGFVKVTRSANISTRNLVNEKLAIQSLNEADYAKAKAKYDPESLRGKAQSMFSRLDKWRFNKTLQNLASQNLFQSITDDKGRLVAIAYSTDGGKSMKKVNITEPGFFEQRLHPIRTLQNRLDVQREISTALGEALKTTDLKVPTVARGYFLYKYMKTKLGVSLKGLVASRYAGKDTREARALLQQDSYLTINDDRPSTYTNTDLREATDDADQDLKNSMQDLEQAAETVDNGGEAPKSVTQKIVNHFDASKLSLWKTVSDGTVRAINPVYDIALPVCLVYDGSRNAPGDIDKKANQDARAGAMVLTNAEVQKDGTSTNGEVVGALNQKLGDTNQSDALREASGETVNTLATSSSPQATAFGGFGETTIFNVLLDGASPDIANKLNKYANDACPTLTNIWFGVGVGVVNVIGTGILSFFSGGGAAAGEALATQGAKQVVLAGLKRTVQHVIEKVTTKQGLKALGGAAYKEVQYWGAVEIATLIAKSLVAAHSLTGNGLSIGLPFANQAYRGVKSMGSDMNRVSFGGRALTDTETLQSMEDDQKFLNTLNDQKSTFERYFSIENSDSMLTKVGMDIRSSLSVNLAGSMLAKVSNIFNPLTITPKLFGAMNQKVAYAAEGNAASRNYGLVQFGWSKAELDLIDKTPSYSSPSENQITFYGRADWQKITEEYLPCIDETTGKIIGDKMIERNNTTGDVAVDKGKCSPQNMGPNNPNYGDGVFRLRLLRFYSGQMKTYEGIENPVEPGSDTATTFPTTGAPGELSWPVAKADGVHISDCFGTRGGSHKGLDIAGPRGTPILAASDGKVTRAGEASGYGPHFVVIESAGTSTSYGHMDSHLVSAGQTVKAGQQIGTLGNMGQSTGPHLHFNAFKGSYKDSDGPNFNPLTVMKIPAGVQNGAGCK